MAPYRDLSKKRTCMRLKTWTHAAAGAALGRNTQPRAQRTEVVPLGAGARPRAVR